MARKPKVTRTFKCVTVKVLCYDAETEKTFTTDVTLPRMYKSEKEVMGKVNTETITGIRIMSEPVIESVLKGMDEDKFFTESEVITKDETETTEE